MIDMLYVNDWHVVCEWLTGGRYSGEMKIDECTHLIITVPRGTYGKPTPTPQHLPSKIDKDIYDIADVLHTLKYLNNPVVLFFYVTY